MRVCTAVCVVLAVGLLLPAQTTGWWWRRRQTSCNPVPCRTGPWSSWGGCRPASSGRCSQQRSRSVITPASCNGACTTRQTRWCTCPSATQSFPGGNQPCYREQRGGTTGYCLQTNCCERSNYISNKCPNYPGNVKCCFGRNTCASQCSTCSDSSARTYACRILALYEQRRIWLKPNHFDSRGNSPYDGASVLSNIRDTCYGRQAKRSRYCSEAPGGCVCLNANMLRNLYDYAVSFYNKYRQRIEVNSLAGSCHSRTSHHYQGTTFDIACKRPRDHCTALVTFCTSRRAIEKCYPGSRCGGHATWVHCAFR